MKNILYITLSLVLLSQLGGCAGFLDAFPSDKTSSGTAMTTLYDAKNAANGMYVAMKWNDYYGSPMMLLGETRGDDLQPRRLDGGGWVAIYTYDFSPETNSYYTLWEKCYNVIMRANTILEGWSAIPALTAGEQAEKDDIKGQALAIRALCLFDVVRLYGYPYVKDNGASLGGVLVTSTIDAAAALNMTRSNVKDTYAQILQDLKDALPLLSKEKAVGKINYWGAKLLQARASLYMGNWDAALAAAKEVIKDSPYQLAKRDEYLNYWSQEGGSETILELLVTRVSNLDDNGGVDSWYYSLWHKGKGTGWLIPTKAWLDLIGEDKDDIRLQMVRTDSDVDKNYKWLAKYPGNNKELFQVNNPRLMRLSEAYFIAAEAALKATAKDPSYADDCLDAIRKRANPNNPLITATEEAILKEKRKEFIGEGHRFFDMMRLGKTITRSGDYHFAEQAGCPTNINWDYHKIVLPISRNQRLLHPELKQNPQYPD